MRILCFGDSNTWGYMPENKPGEYRRYPENIRWTQQLQKLLEPNAQVIEEGLNGRTTALDEPGRDGRNGLTYLNPCLESHFPLNWLVLMLGTNDLKAQFNPNAQKIAERIESLIQCALNKSRLFNPEKLNILLISPMIPKLGLSDKPFQHLELIETAKSLASEYKKVADRNGVQLLNLANQIESSRLDGIHLDQPMLTQLAHLVAESITSRNKS